ncbi:uncharacterized protein LOC112089850 [Eutrema salsugineum]|uniref:uncharacterized protein LOC112089850 n=1 Tax=Eutrema salsugineum TaxID=72664 RepID=UPI000CED22CB|nr:uncharacterized protein LOC112089850 [Eutrema salsugineum]
MYSNKDIDPYVTLRMAETEATLWEEAERSGQESIPVDPSVSPTMSVPMAYGRWWCYIDGVTEKIVGAQNVRRSLTRLHAETEDLIGVMHCMLENQKMEVAFATDCLELVKMVSTPEE